MEIWLLVHNLTDLANGKLRARVLMQKAEATHPAHCAGAHKLLTVCTLAKQA